MTTERKLILPSHFASLGALALLGTLGIAVSAPVRADGPAAAVVAARRGDATNFALPAAISWKFTSSYSPTVSGAPIVDNGTLYFASANRIFAIDPQSGGVKWRYPSDAALNTTITGVMTLNNGTLYFSAGDGLYAINATDGKLRWPRYGVRVGVDTSPVVIGDRVYFGSSDAKLYAVNTATGEPADGIWSTAKSVGIASGGDFIGDMAVSGDTVYYVTSDQVIHAVNVNSGSQRWAQRMTANMTSATPVVGPEYVYLAAGDTLYAFRASSGQPRVSAKLGNDAAVAPVVDTDGTAYVINQDRYMIAIDQRGRYLWKKAPRLDNETDVAPVIANDMLIVGTSQGGLYAFDKTTAELKWRFVIKPSATTNATIPVTTSVSAPPVISNGTLFVFTDDGTITAMRADATDKIPPTVVPLTPDAGDALSGRPPFYISASISDEGSGLDLKTLALKVDDKPVARKADTPDAIDKVGFTFDEDRGFLQYVINESNSGRNTTLADGPHTITITVKDYMGNTTTKTWTFHADESLTKRSRRYGTGTGNGNGAGNGNGNGNGNGSNPGGSPNGSPNGAGGGRGNGRGRGRGGRGGGGRGFGSNGG